MHITIRLEQSGKDAGWSVWATVQDPETGKASGGGELGVEYYEPTDALADGLEQAKSTVELMTKWKEEGA